MKLIDSLVTQAAGIAAVRRDLHAHPELCFQEVRTADVVAGQAHRVGHSHSPRARHHRGGRHRQERHQRAAPSAFAPTWTRCPSPSSPPSPTPASTTARCTPAATTATPRCCWRRRQHLAKHRNFDGTVYLIFQPAEEGGGGARDDQGRPVRAVPDGGRVRHAQLARHEGPASSRSAPGRPWPRATSSRITDHGKGGHAALPHTGIDPVPVACEMVQAFQTILTRNKKPTDSAVISVTMIHGGEANNVIPDNCELSRARCAPSRSRCWT